LTDVAIRVPTESVGFRNQARAWWRGLNPWLRVGIVMVLQLVLFGLLFTVDHALGFAVLVVSTIYWLRRLPDRIRQGATGGFILLMIILAIVANTPWTLVILLAVGAVMSFVPAARRDWVFPAVLLGLAVLYPFYADQMFTMPIFGVWPDVGTGVYMLVFIMMAVGLNIVVGYAGLLDLGYVAFYAMGAYTSAWLMSLLR